MVPSGAHIAGREWQLRLQLPRINIDAGDAVIAVTRLTARGRGSGAEFTNRIVLMYGLRDGQIAYLDAYRTKTEALEAAGLSE